ncbi:30S ribosomal protein S3 [Candidatus Woesebacteria bacterium]|nr:30S ribosomal protein S3 [Candidatus Woesebacteria bacterium]MCD8507639.1 30S ribosomal protein S3 [Candidatus Woesebacteria bacterium]MCD8526775.1 30S ribosomal protein S3 [Candidatus Woesebacteria bacterium]MCD8546479.1 30S ribosomal protein S3 [Candidatus Woesebacteria bacterium]
MGQKINPTGFRIGNTFSWKSTWYANSSDYAKRVLEDKKIRDFFRANLSNAGLDTIEIERSINVIKIRLHVTRPGVVIGRGGSNLELLKKNLAKLLKINPNDPKGMKVSIDEIVEVKNPDTSAKFVVERIADQLSKRYPHRRAVSQAIERAMNAGAKGIKIQLSGRIGGAEIGRREKYHEGTIPTQTIRANIDYYESPAHTKSGTVGIKVWVNKGEVEAETK